MKLRKDSISHAEIKDALLRSGYVLESRIESVLRRNHYHVETNIFIPDPDSGKPRELDMSAHYPYKAGQEERDFLYAFLVIECINNPQPIAFFTKPQRENVDNTLVKISGLPTRALHRKYGIGWQELPSYLDMSTYHHYFKGRVATQFCSFVSKKGTQDWMATHDETHFESFRKLSTALEYYCDRHLKDWVHDLPEPIGLNFYYPIVVVQGDLIDVRVSGGLPTFDKANHVQFRRSENSGSQRNMIQFDVVTESYFPKYLKLIQREMVESAQLLFERNAELRTAITQIVKDLQAEGRFAPLWDTADSMETSIVNHGDGQ